MAVFGVEQRVAVRAGGKKMGFVPAVTVCVWLENTQCPEYLSMQVGHQENNWLFTWPINDSTLLLLGLFVFMKKKQKQTQLISIPGSGAQIGSSKQKASWQQGGR